jgi:hypothetical protein
MSVNSLATEVLSVPLATISKACSSGTPAFIMVASCRVKSAMSASLIRPPSDLRPCFLIFVTAMPCRRSALTTIVSPFARVSPRTIFPARLRPSQT